MLFLCSSKLGALTASVFASKRSFETDDGASPSSSSSSSSISSSNAVRSEPIQMGDNVESPDYWMRVRSISISLFFFFVSDAASFSL